MRTRSEDPVGNDISRSAAVALTLAFILTIGLAGSAQAQTYMFNRADYVTGLGPQTLAVGDFNGDGVMDVVVGNTGDPAHTVSVLLGKSDGTLGAAVSYPAGGEPGSVAVGDFNGDGKLDIVVLYGVFNAQVSVLLGNGDGTFQTTPIVTMAGPLGTSIAVGDFDGDGKLDVAIADNETPNMGADVMLGKGDGTFGSVQPNPTASDPRMVVVGDFNGDHKLDLATVSAAGQAISVLLGKGDGTFQTHQDFATTTTGCLSLAVGDLRHIGKLDIVAGCQSASGVNIFLSSGGGQFQASTNYPVPAGVDDVVVGDFNGDGKLDVAVTNGGTTGMVSVLPGIGNGTFNPAVVFGTGLQPTAIGAADFNRDGKLDLVTANSGNLTGAPMGNVSVLLSNGKTLFDGRSEYAVGTSSSDASSIAAGDLNGDKKPDLVLAIPAESQISVLMNKGNGTFDAFAPYTDPYGPLAIVTGDFNNDHLIDVAVLNANTDGSGNYTVSVFYNIGNGVLAQKPAQYPVAGGAGGSPFTGANAIAVGDFNKDGNLDIVTTGTSNTNGNTVSVLLGTGNGFQTYQSYATGGKTAPTGVVVGDFNHDGWLDFAVGNSADNTVSIFLNNADGKGQFTLQQPLTPAGGNPVTLAAGRFRRNGPVDLAIALGGAFPGLGILKGNGDGTFQTVVTYSTPNNGYAVAVGDFNHDGTLDVALSLVNPGAPGFVTLLPGRGDGSFSSEVNLITGALLPISIVAADFNGDGGLDLATANESTSGNTGSATVLLNRPVIGLSKTRLAFSPQKVGTTSAPKAITVANPGATPLKVSVLINGDFQETNNCPAKVAVGASCTIDVTFSPSVKGHRTGTLTIKDNALSSPQKLPLTGTGT